MRPFTTRFLTSLTHHLTLGALAALPLACSAAPGESVEATTESALTATTTWATYGMPVSTQVAAARGPDGKLAAFGLVSAGGALALDAQAVVNGGWSAPSSLAGNSLQQFAVGHDADGRLEAFAIGGDGALYHIWQTNLSGTWGTWSGLGGTQLRQVALVNEADGRLRAFVLGGDRNVYTIAQTSPNGGWGSYSLLGGAPLAQVLAGTDPNGAIEIIGLTTSGVTTFTQETAPNSNAWGAFASLGGWASKLAVSQNADGRIEIDQLGTGGVVWHEWRTPAGAWSGWYSLTASGKDIVAGREANGSIDLFLVGLDGGIYELTQNGANGGWGNIWPQIGPGPFEHVAVASNADGHLELLGLTTGGVIEHAWQVAPNGAWAGATPPPPPPPPPTCTGAQPQYAEWWVPGPHEIEFTQLAPGEAPNPDTQCYSGCGPTAWAMFFASVDSHWRPLEQEGQATWWTSQPSWFQTSDTSGVIYPSANTNQITMDISHHLGTSCSAPFSNGAYTEPTWMASAGDYINQGPESKYIPHGPLGPYAAAGFTYQYDTHNTGDSLAVDSLNDYGTLDYARDWIINYGYPVVYGYYVTPTAAHYGLATGYREKAETVSCENIGGAMQWVVTKSDNTKWQFYINGGGGDSDDWRSPSAYYVGTIKINKK